MPDIRKEFMEQLENKKIQLEEALNRLIRHQRETNDQRCDDGQRDESDEAQQEISLLSSYRLIEKKSKELQSIDYLLVRLLRDQEFGLCEECGDLIPAERLLIVPETDLCITCQRELENHARKRGMSAHGQVHLRGIRRTERDDSDDLDELQYDLMDRELQVFPLPVMEDEDLETQDR